MTNLFLKMLLNLRQEEVMLYGNLLSVQDSEVEDVIYFLETEYQEESISYPHETPDFHPQAALWAAKTVYFASQLILYRENQPKELVSLFPSFEGVITPSAILSADLCLRFIPSIITKLKIIDAEDPLVDILENIISIWHYSAIGYSIEYTNINFSTIPQSPCLYQLYIDRIIERKVHSLAELAIFKAGIQASLGWHSQLFWSDLKFSHS
ncbi:hypothetical protein [Aureispira sp. CCB-QB1]|uniref:hypothetical protein n=1 Tax=Aureispira sp. CCB-QB1 TaxID=1313421 RepID=UPI0006988A74|nr:hypothetical protein [Aureispira sp. CCB-QB1]